MLSSFINSRAKCIKFIFFINLLVFISWQFTFKLEVKEFLVTNFLVSPLHIMEGKYFNLIFAAFSHNLLWHFLLNMFVLISFGPVIEQLLGKKRFLIFYILAAVVSSISHCAVSLYLLGAKESMALGASGAISALVILFSFLFPREKLYILGLVPIPALTGALLFVGIDVWGLVMQTKGSMQIIGHGAHLGGALCGIMYFIRLKLTTRS